MRIPLTGGAYEARSILANAQRCVNLYPEINPQSSEAPVPVTHYPTPGLTLLAASPVSIVMRCCYRASNGALYVVIGTYVYYVNQLFTLTQLGRVTSENTPVSMSDNGLVVVIVDGTSNGYAIKMVDNTFGTISATNFYGADRVDYVDTYFLFNRPNTNQWYISLSNVTYSMLTGGIAFDSLDIASKTGSPDPLMSIIVMHREVWLIGALTTEIWYNSGAADFTFQIIPGAFIEHGCVAKYSVAAQDLSVYWLSQDRQGQTVVIKGGTYQAKRISTHAIENEFSTYSTISDAIGFTYQQDGHTFYVLIFPTADKTWVYDEATDLWHERAWTDSDGILHRHRANCYANAYGKSIVGDWENGTLYALDLNTYTDNGAPITRIRSFPHLLDDGKRVTYSQFIADMQVGTDDGADGSSSTNPPTISLRFSDTRGASWGTKIEQSLGATGQYYTSVQFNRLGMARDRVFELSWSAPCMTALNGAFIQKNTAIT